LKRVIGIYRENWNRVWLVRELTVKNSRSWSGMVAEGNFWISLLIFFSGQGIDGS
jgi:hypothetical protein